MHFTKDIRKIKAEFVMYDKIQTTLMCLHRKTCEPITPSDDENIE